MRRRGRRTANTSLPASKPPYRRVPRIITFTHHPQERTPMTPRTPALVAALAALAIGTAHGQTCTEPHYRWSEKVDTSFAHQTPTDVDVSGMLAWTPRTITAKDKCAKRIGREKNVYGVTAYVRPIKLRESDGDWHIEITEEESTPVPASCVIVEIPAPANGSRYGEARDQLAGLVDTTHL